MILVRRQETKPHELVPMWAAQSANLAHHSRATERLDSLVSGVSAMLDDKFAFRGR